MSIRKAKKNEVKSIYNLMLQGMEDIQDPDHFAPETMESLNSHLNSHSQSHSQRKDFILVFEENKVLCGYFIAYIPGNAPDSLARDLHLEEALYEKVVHMESVVVLNKYRGKKIGKQLITYGEELLKNQGFEYFLATVHPENIPSLKIFLSLGYEIACTKEKYDNKLRYILLKKI